MFVSSCGSILTARVHGQFFGHANDYKIKMLKSLNKTTLTFATRFKYDYDVHELIIRL